MNRHVWLVAGGLLMLLVGCASAPPLASTFSSPEALATAVLDALARSDRPRLDALALSEQEFRGHVWPGLPAAKPERNLPFSYVWGDLRQKSQFGLASTLRAHGGKTYTLARLSFDGETRYPGYVVHRDAVFRVRDLSGVETQLRACGSFIEKDGAWKVFSYVIDR